MGKIKQGILGGFSGKVGTVVGSNWNSINYMRALAVNVANPNTEKQQCQRGRFLMALTFLKTFAPLIRMGYSGNAVKMSAFNAAMSYTLKNAVTGCGTDSSIDYSRVLVSRGSLTMGQDAAVSVGEGKASFTWTDNSGMNDAAATDTALLMVYNKVTGEAVYDTESATRADGKAELLLPSNWDAADALAVYMGFCSEDGAEVSNSLCLQNDAVSGGDASGGSSDSGSGEEDPFG